MAREPRAPLALTPAQERAVAAWAADDRLWMTEETVAYNLGTFARVILAHAPVGVAPPPAVTKDPRRAGDGVGQAPPPPCPECALGDPRLSPHRADYRILTNGETFAVEVRRWWFTWRRVLMWAPSLAWAEHWIAAQQRWALAGAWRVVTPLRLSTPRREADAAIRTHHGANIHD